MIVGLEDGDAVTVGLELGEMFGSTEGRSGEGKKVGILVPGLAVNVGCVVGNEVGVAAYKAAISVALSTRLYRRKSLIAPEK